MVLQQPRWFDAAELTRGQNCRESPLAPMVPYFVILNRTRLGTRLADINYRATKMRQSVFHKGGSVNVG
jgi:hypothetical protein